MNNKFRNFWQILGKQKSQAAKIEPPESAPNQERDHNTQVVEFDPEDPVIAYFQSAPGVVEVDKIDIDSPAVRSLKAAGIKLTVPLISQGELIGLLNLGPRLSEQEYSADDHGLLSNLATQAAPALRVAQLVREQQIEAQARERLEQELRVARLIQQTLLPKELPSITGWKLNAYYQPARAVGGDFYDFIPLADGRLGIVVGDVTDKGVPAALVMATTRSILRSAAGQFSSPGDVLERANNLLYPDIPERMFVTCSYSILDPKTGRLVYANAGHDLPYRRNERGVDELRATGMPLGLMMGMKYDQKEIIIQPGETVLYYSDGLVEAHSRNGEMFGFPRLKKMVGEHPGGEQLVGFLLDALDVFTGVGWEQEDDVTLLTLQRTEGSVTDDYGPDQANRHLSTSGWQTLAEFSLPSEPGNERQVMEQVGSIFEQVIHDPTRLERLKTAVAEATMNAMEHGNKYRPDAPVTVQVLQSTDAVAVRIIDQGAGQEIPEPEAPNIEAKLAGAQTPRGWGLFLMKNMVDEINVSKDEKHHVVELILYREGGANAEPPAL